MTCTQANVLVAASACVVVAPSFLTTARRNVNCCLCVPRLLVPAPRTSSVNAAAAWLDVGGTNRSTVTWEAAYLHVVICTVEDGICSCKVLGLEEMPLLLPPQLCLRQVRRSRCAASLRSLPATHLFLNGRLFGGPPRWGRIWGQIDFRCMHSESSDGRWIACISTVL